MALPHPFGYHVLRLVVYLPQKHLYLHGKKFESPPNDDNRHAVLNV